MNQVSDAEWIYRAWKQSGGRERSLQMMSVAMIGTQDE
jgi:hypothetical protein